MEDDLPDLLNPKRRAKGTTIFVGVTLPRKCKLQLSILSKGLNMSTGEILEPVIQKLWDKYKNTEVGDRFEDQIRKMIKSGKLSYSQLEMLDIGIDDKTQE